MVWHATDAVGTGLGDAITNNVIRLVALVAAIGMSIGAKASAHDVTAIKDALLARGTAEEEALRFEPLVVEMADDMNVPCEAVPGEFNSVTSSKLRSVVFGGPIPDDVWAQALSRVRAIASRVGADELIVRVDQRGHHNIQMIGADKVRFGLRPPRPRIMTTHRNLIAASTSRCLVDLEELQIYCGSMSQKP